MKSTVHQTPKMKLPGLAKKGLTQSNAARELGVSRQRVSQLAAQLNLTFRPSYPPVPKALLARLAKKGLTQTEAARELVVSQKRVRTLAAKVGVSFAPVWSRPRKPTTKLGRVLQTARLASGYSYARLGVLSSLHRHHVMDIELGRVLRPTKRTLQALANCLDGHTSYDELDRAAGKASRRARTGARRAGIASGQRTTRKASQRGR
jgi:transcriptional regulator with XRE-family HTH domain